MTTRGLIRQVVVLSILWLPIQAATKTIHVEKWGALVNCGSKSNPCATLAIALGVASKNDRIIVGPGLYSGNPDINVEGLRIQSSNGPHVTLLRAAAANDNVITINQRKVHIGRKGKGLTLYNATSALTAGVRVTSPLFDGVRVEGNVFDGNRIGIYLQGDKAVARHNLVLNSEQLGIYIINGDKGQIRDNRIIQNEGRGITLWDSAHTVVQNNVIHGAETGIFANNGSHSNRLLTNAIVGGKGSPTTALLIASAENNRIEGNAFSRFSWGLYMGHDSGPQLSPTTIKNNAAVGFSGNAFTFFNGISAPALFSLKIDGNDAHGSNQSGFSFEGLARPDSMSKNNTVDNQLNGIFNATGVPITYKKAYFGLINGVPSSAYNGTTGNFDPSSTEAPKPNPFKARKAAGLM